MFVVISRLAAGRIAKFLECATREEAEAHLARLSAAFPAAFIYEGAYSPDLFVDDAGAVTLAPLDDWRADAMAALRVRRDRLLDVISGMQADYITAADQPSAELCLTIKQQLKDLPTHPTLAAAQTRADFNAAVVALWRAIAAPAPVPVRMEFARYAGGAE